MSRKKYRMTEAERKVIEKERQRQYYEKNKDKIKLNRLKDKN